MMDIRQINVSAGRELVEQFHGYKAAGAVATYAFGVFENERMIAYYQWNPPAPGAAVSVCEEAPYAVLSLARMVALPKTERSLKHVSKPLMVQMKKLIDRGRWPVLLTYSDSSLGHNGYVYQCSGFKKTQEAKRNYYQDASGKRMSSYTNGSTRKGLVVAGTTVLSRWEHWACERGCVRAHMAKNNWFRVESSRVWRSGNRGFDIVRIEDAAP